MFQIIKKDKHTKARLGLLKTPHGTVKTPAYVMVATHGQIKCLKPSDIKKTKTQLVIANTYHLWPEVAKIRNQSTQINLSARPSSQQVESSGSKFKTFLLQRLGTKLPTMTDSGGFQVFSLAFGQHDKAGKIFPRETMETQKKTKNTREETKRKNVRITNKGVYFKKWDDLRCRPIWRFLGPELSMKLQQKIGADIIFAFDECTSFFDGFEYNKGAMERTHRWAVKCLSSRSSRSKASGNPGSLASGDNARPKQMLFGIVQGGRYKKLRIRSAKFIGSLPFDGFGIGGSFGKEEMAEMLKWVIPHLPEEKPRHLLGIGRIEDIFRAVENGIDLFDCVVPTREARHGRIWTAHGHYDIRKSSNINKKSSLEKGCRCETCKKITGSELRELFKDAQPIRQAQGKRWATIHNVYFFNTFVEKIRDSIAKGKFREFKKKFLTAKTQKIYL